MSKSDIEDLIICSSQNNSHYIPQDFCKSYLFNFRGTKRDIQNLESRSGISSIFGLNAEHDKETLFNFLVSKNININKISPIDGFSQLHAAVLENNKSLVEKLLKSGVDKSVISSSTNNTALELAQQLQLRGQEDYSEIVNILSID